MSDSRHIVRQPAMQARQNAVVMNPINPLARCRTTSLGDCTGLTKMGVHINVIAPGDVSSEPHMHACVDEFIFVLSGRGTVSLGGNDHPLAAGDFVGFPANGPAHTMTNSGTEDLVYLIGGNRAEMDVCDYPLQGKRLYLYEGQGGRQQDVVDTTYVQPLRN